MSKYSNEFKLKVIKYYLEENHSFLECCKKFNIPSTQPVRQWVHRYEKHGVEGIFKQLKSSYDGIFKLKVIEYMHSNHLSATETSDFFRLGNSGTVLRWERKYYEEGPQAFYEEHDGRKRKMKSKTGKNKLSKDTEEDLIAENQRLRMENEYLKKLNALVQERIKRENKKK